MVSGIIPQNLVDAISMRLGRTDREVRQADWLREWELAKSLGSAAESEPRFYPFFLLLATAGLRFGEAVALQVHDLDLDNARVYVRRAQRKHRLSSPKNGKARTVHLPPSTVAELRRWLDVVRAEAAVRGQEALWLFPGPRSGEPRDDGHIRQAFTRCLKPAGIARRIRPHDLRHTYASLAIQRGVPLLVVSRQLGHASIAITADIYGHLDPNAGQGAAAVWEEIARGIIPAPATGRNPRATAAG